MWRSVCPGENFRRSIRLEQSDRRCWTIQTHSKELNWASRRTFHEINSLRLVRLMKSSTFGLGLKVPAYVQRTEKKCSRSAIHMQPVFLFTCIVCFNVVNTKAVRFPFQRRLKPVHMNPGKSTCGFKKVGIRVDGALGYRKLSAVTVNVGREPWQSILTCLPPRVHNDTPFLSHHLMIPMPCLGVNWFTNYKKKNKKVTLNAVHSTEFENITDFLPWKRNK